MNIQEIIKYWILSADDDWKVANHLFEKRNYHCTLFFAHLYLDKLLKALAVKGTGEQAPPVDNLRLSAEKGNLSLSDEQLEFLLRVNEYNVRTRYPDFKFEFKRRCTKNLLKMRWKNKGVWIMVKEDAIRKVKGFIKVLEEEGVEIKEACLYGSYAKGNVTSFSDFDVAIVSSSFTGEPMKDVRIALPVLKNSDSGIEPVYFHPDDFRDENALLWEMKKI